jgi:rhodanese-related sulfurtransferase
MKNVIIKVSKNGSDCMKKLMLVLTTLLCSCTFLFCSAKTATDTFYTDVTAEQGEVIITENIDNPDFIILDVRSPSEYEEGHIENAININYYDSDFTTQLDTLEKNKTYFLYCRSGSRSRRALKKMKELGFNKIYHLKRGFNSWGK